MKHEDYTYSVTGQKLAEYRRDGSGEHTFHETRYLLNKNKC